MNEVTLQQILDAREARAAEQTRLTAQYRTPLICFTMNVAGPVKTSPLILRAFSHGLARLDAALTAAELPVLYREERREATGCEAFYAVRAPAQALKRLCVSVEEAEPIGRLFDVDVLDADGQKLSRVAERSCLVCGAGGRGCASRRLHTAAELQAATARLITAHFSDEDARSAAELVTQALLEEVDTTPKPGLVDRSNNGSHTDMTPQTFRQSAAALRPYWETCFRLGVQTAAQPPAAAFALLREAGKQAEQTMLAATQGVNTHKGAIFLLGTVCGAIGRLWDAAAPCRDAARILAESGSLARAAVAADFASMRRSEKAETAGAALYLQLGLTGARGQLVAGVPAVGECALPLFARLLQEGVCRNDAGAITLLALIARGEDTNLFHRGGREAASAAAAAAAALLADGRRPTMDEIAALDRRFIERGLSPGGSADLLAATYFLYDWKA